LTAVAWRDEVEIMKRTLLAVLLVLIVGGLAAWHWQSQLIGTGAQWYLGRIAHSEGSSGTVERRSAILTQLNRYLLMPPPPDVYVPELFDLVTALSSRVATGEVSLNWAAYIYTAYQRDMVQQRPTGRPRRSIDEVNAELGRYIQFFAIQKRPDQQGVTVGDLMGTGDDVITLDEIQQSEKSGKEIDLRTRGAKEHQ
jgi:hypothetical protein